MYLYGIVFRIEQLRKLDKVLYTTQTTLTKTYSSSLYYPPWVCIHYLGHYMVSPWSVHGIIGEPVRHYLGVCMISPCSLHGVTLYHNPHTSVWYHLPVSMISLCNLYCITFSNLYVIIFRFVWYHLSIRVCVASCMLLYGITFKSA